jgi:hypothetical protein
MDTSNKNFKCFNTLSSVRLCMAALLTASFSVSEPAFAKRKENGTTQALRLEIERLKRENLVLQKTLEEKTNISEKIVSAPPNPSISPKHRQKGESPFYMQDIQHSSTHVSKASVPGSQEMACGSRMGEMTCGGVHRSEHFEMFTGHNEFTMNPVFGGVDQFWNMPKDTFMMNVKWMHNQQGGLQNGTTPGTGGTSSMMPSTGQSMDMFMFMPMWGVTEDLTLMAMINYQYMSMPMNMSMSGETTSQAPMNVGGIGDTNLDVIYRLPWIDNLVGTLQLNLPTGSTQVAYSPAGMGPNNDTACKKQGLGNCYNQTAPYGMQLGSGVVGLMPALTYNWFSMDGEWNVGGQASGTAWMGTNNGWSPGNSVKFSVWGQKDFGNFMTWVRSNFSIQTPLVGCDPSISGNRICSGTSQNPNYYMYQFNPANYGGQVGTVMIGGSYNFKMFSLGLEGGVPYYQNLNGVQNMNSYQINSGVAVMW